MMAPLPIVGLVVGSVLFFINSYLLLIRDLYKLEVISDVYNAPLIEELGTKLFYSLNVNIVSLALLFISFAILIVSFIYTIKLPANKLSIKTALPAIIIIYLLFFASFPILSNDIFDYHNGARILITHQANPITTPANQFSDDNHLFMGSWQFRPIAYPPITTWLFAIPYALSGQNLIASVFGFKALTTMFLISAIFLLSYWTKKEFLSPQILLIAANPLLLVEFVANGHNDIIMASLSLAAVLFFMKKSYFKSAAFLAIASITKFTVLLFVPILILKLLLDKKPQAITIFSISFAVASALVLLPIFGSTTQMVKTTLEQSNIIWRSFPAVLSIISQQLFPQVDSLNISNGIKIISIIIMIGFFLITSITEKPRFKLISTLVLLMLSYIFFASPILHPWYIVWFLLFVPLLTSKRLKLAMLVFSISALSYHLILNLSYYLSPQFRLWEIALYLFAALPPILILLSPAKWYTRLTNFLRI